jgi:hypothetical protein
VVELPETCLAVVKALVRAPVAWQTPDDLAAALGWNAEQTTDVLALLDAAGWVEVWEREPGPVVTLSPLGAERLGVRLMERGAEETPRWIGVGEPDQSPLRAKNVCSYLRAANLDFVADPLLPPDLAVEAAEHVTTFLCSAQTERFDLHVCDELPKPTLLLGQSLTPWPGPGHERDAICPACGTAELMPHMYCLYCDRWGLDDLMQTARPAHRLHHTRPGHPADEARRRRTEIQHEQVARTRRRAKLRARLAAQNQAEQVRRRRNGTGGHGNSPLAGPGPPAVS